MKPPSYSGGLSVADVQTMTANKTVHKLSSNENPFPPSPKVIKAVQSEAAKLNIYPPRNDDPLRAALSDYFGRNLTADYFYTGDSGYEAIDLVSRAFVNEGDEVIVSRPTFGAYFKILALQGAKFVDAPLNPDTFVPDVDAILAAITERTKLIMVCNPGNPTGVIMTADQMDKLVANVPDHVIIVADEVYSHFNRSPEFPDSIKYVLENKNVIILHTFSKAFGLAGLRLGYGIAAPHLTAEIWRHRRVFHINKLAMAAGIAALEDRAYTENAIATILEEKDKLIRQMKAMGIKVWPSETNFLLFRQKFPAKIMFERLTEEGIMVRYPEGDGLPDCLRVSIGSAESNKAFIDAIIKIMAPY